MLCTFNGRADYAGTIGFGISIPELSKITWGTKLPLEASEETKRWCIMAHRLVLDLLGGVGAPSSGRCAGDLASCFTLGTVMQAGHRTTGWAP